MGDDSYPTAIVPVRPLATQQERFAQLSRRLGDPMAALFMMGASTQDPDLKFKAYAELMPYGYTKLKPSDINVNAAPGAGGGVQVIINLGAPPPSPTIDVTPARPALPPVPAPAAPAPAPAPPGSLPLDPNDFTIPSTEEPTTKPDPLD